MKEKQMSIHLRCPWCEGSETLADGKGKVTISVQCPKCKHIYKLEEGEHVLKIAEEFNISRKMVSKIKSGRSYAWVEC